MIGSLLLPGAASVDRRKIAARLGCR